jgi:hypothetical protein
MKPISLMERLDNELENYKNTAVDILSFFNVE